jgi:hypothetical protein
MIRVVRVLKSFSLMGLFIYIYTSPKGMMSLGVGPLERPLGEAPWSWPLG